MSPERTRRKRRLPPTAWGSFGAHLLFAMYKGALSLWYGSAWMGATALYYLMLSLTQLLLLRGRGGWRSYRCCGALLLVLTAAVGAVNYYTIRDGQAVIYPWHLIYGAAAYTFYSLYASLIRIARRKAAPEEGAGALLSLASALVAVLSLQGALLAAFGDSGAWQRLMGILTGLAVFSAIAAMAVHMLRKGTEELKKLP